MPAALVSLVSCAYAGAYRQWDLVALCWGVVALIATAFAVIVAWLASGPRGVRWRRRRDFTAVCALACALTAVVTLTAAARWHHDVPEWARSPTSGERVTIEGTVVSDSKSAGRDPWTGEERWSVAVEAIEACVAPCVDARPVRMTVDVVGASGTPPRLGARVRVDGRASVSRDTRRVLTLWDARVSNLNGSNRVLAVVASVRDSARVAAKELPDEVRGLALGMTIGDASDIPPSLGAAMLTTGLTHLTAVSGSHFAIVTLALGWLLRRTIRSRPVRAAMLAVGMCALAALVLPEPSVLRALTMSLSVALGWWWGRPARALPALGAGLLVLLLAEPGLAGAIGLQLSVVAVIAIVVWSPRLAVVLGRWMLAPLARAIAVPLSASIGCWPLLVALRPGVGPYAVPANLVSALAAFPVTVIGLLGTVVSTVWAGGGALLMQAAGVCAWPVAWSARAFAAAPGAWIAWPQGIGGIALAAAVTGCVVIATATVRLKAGFRLAAAIVAVVLAGTSPAWTVTVGPVMHDWRVVVCDVGQGDMMMVRIDDNSAVVIDTGPAGGAGASCLHRYGVTHVPLLVLTHPHADHDGAVTELAAAVSIDRAWVSPAATTPGHDVGARDAASAGIPVSVPRPADAWSDGDVSLAVVYAPASVASASTSSEINDSSIALAIRAGPLSVLALGDLEEEGQGVLARDLRGPVVVDLVKVAHHGSASQLPALASLITARVAAISVGVDNPYGHPAPETTALYGSRALALLTTAECGDIALGDSTLVEGAVASGCPTNMAG
jgi:competence protein ComEC